MSRLVLLPGNPESYFRESQGVLIAGQLELPETHRCDAFVGGRCLTCWMLRLLMDGEKVSIDLVVHDVDDSSV